MTTPLIKWTNWVGNQSFTPSEVATANNEADMQYWVKYAAERGLGVRTVGTGHSFTPIVETDVLLNTEAMRGITRIDAANRRVLFINADREFAEGRAQNELLPEHIEKIVRAWEALTKHIELRDGYEAKRHPAPPRTRDQFLTLVAGAFVGAGLIYTIGRTAVAVFGRTSDVAGWSVVGGAVALGGLALRAERRSYNRWLVFGLTLSLAFFLVIVAWRMASTAPW